MKLSDFQLSDDLEQQELLATVRRFNDNRTEYPRHKTVHALFSERAAMAPAGIAVIEEAGPRTYGELDGVSNRIARMLIDGGLQREQCVAVILDRPFDMIASILGILKAGGVYVPIDYDASYERIKYILRDTQSVALLSEKRHIRMLNRLQWDCPSLRLLFCADTHDIHAESEGTGDMMREVIWDEVGRTAFNDISGGGWTSSYTGEWLSREVMDEYGENIRKKLAPLLTSKSRVLEIACASGISMFRLAPKVAHYHGTDLSAEILRWTEREVQKRNLTNITLEHLPAHDVHRASERNFDVVVLNSVIQCFSGHNYLRDVLRKSIDLMSDRGFVFLGNLWEQDKKEQFVESLSNFARTHAGEGYRTKIDRSEELFISQSFLEDLRHDFPEVAGIEYSQMLGSAESELSEFGYDAILRIDKTRAAAAPAARVKVQLDASSLERYPDTAIPERTTPEGLAYVMYTSGTSGQPKGVMVEHRAIVRLVRNTNYVQLVETDRCLQTGALAFDASTFEIWGMLLNGGAVCRPREWAILDPSEVERLVRQHGITTMWLTSSLFNQHVEARIEMFAGLRYLLVGGEKLSPYHINKVRSRYPDLILINGYGPTENTTFTTCYWIDRTYAADIPIGRPISNTEVLILDSNMRLTATGAVGEIFAGGDGLARGYLNDPDLTRAKFVDHPFEPGKRLYRTGDLGRWLPEGVVEYLGRADDQVKIRGYRVEPSEIESRLSQLKKVREAVVLVRNSELCAYVTCDDGLDVDDLREYLKRNVPDYMVPAHFMKLDVMPLNSNGKVDRRALPDPVSKTDAVRTIEPPRTDTEREIALIWQEALNRKDIGVTDNFFDSGGHSLKVAKVVSLIERKLGVAVPLAAVFKHATIRELAAYVLDKARFGIDIADEPMLCLSGKNASSVARSIFAFPPGTGDAAGFIQVAESLKPFTFYGFNFIEADTRISDYADLVISVDAEGPYLFFGYSSGGNLAYHVAHELERRGKTVSDIVMVDSGRRFERFPFDPEEVRSVANEFLNHESNAPYLNTVLLKEKAFRRVESSYAYFENAVDHHRIASNIHLITSENSVDDYRDNSGTLISSKTGWADVTTGSFHKHQGVGDHNHMLYQPYLEDNARLIRRILGHESI